MFRGNIQIQNAGLLVAIFALSACGGTTTLISTPAPTPSAEQSATVEESDSAESLDNEVTEATPNASSSVGSRQQPAPVGSTAVTRDASGGPVWEVTLLESDLDANTVVAEENQFNEPPPAGFQYAAATLRVTYLGMDKGFPGMDISVAFVTKEGTTHKPSDISVIGPDDLRNENELYQGGSAVGSVYIAIPTAGADSGTWRISQFFNDSEFFFAAK